MLPWAGYVRVSHVGGRGGDRFHSPRDQAADIERYAKERGHGVVLLAHELNESGGRRDRPILNEAVTGVEHGRYRGILVAYMSRLARDTRHLLDVWERVERAGGTVVAIGENIDTSTAAGRFLRTVIAGMDEMTREQHAERFDNLRRSSVERGIWQRRQTPLGYTRDPVSRTLVADEHAAAVVAAFGARLRGRSMSEIARGLGMTPSGTRALLRNRVYLGELKVGPYVNPSAHPPLIDQELFDAVQESRSIRGPRSERADGPALLAGLVRCVGCGHVMSRSATAVPVYSCHRSHSGGSCPEPAAVTLGLLDAHVERIAVAEFAKVDGQAATNDAPMQEARADLKAAQAELAAYLQAVSAVDVGAEAFGAAARERQQRVEAARARVGRLLAQRPAVPTTGTLASVWEDLDAHERNELLRALLEVVLVRRAGGRGARTPLADRVRVLRGGTAIDLPRWRGGDAAGLVRVAWPDAEGPGVLGVPAAHDPLGRPGR